MQLTVSSTMFQLEPETEDDRRLLRALENAIPGGSITVVSPGGDELRYDFCKQRTTLKIAEGT